MAIFKLNPAFKDYLWGGTRLRDEYGKDCDFDKVAESWELSCHKDGNSVVDNGEYAGCTLAEYIEKAGKQVLGKKVGDRFTVQVNESYSYVAEIRSITKTEDDGSAPLMQF